MSYNNLVLSINKIFSCFENKEKIELKYLINCKILLKIGLQLSPNLFKPLQSSLTFDNNYGILMIELTEIKKLLLNILEKSDFKPNDQFEEIKNIDMLLLAKYDENESMKLIKLIILDIFFCDEKINLIENIDKLDENNQNEIYEILESYVFIEEERETMRDTLRQTLRATIRQSVLRESLTNNKLNTFSDEQSIEKNNIFTDSFHKRIQYLENELNKEIEKNKVLNEIKMENNNLKTENIELKSQLSSLKTQKDFLEKTNEINENKINQLLDDNSKVKDIKEELETKKRENNEIIEEMKKLKEEKIQNHSILKQFEEKLNSQIELSNDAKLKYEQYQKQYNKVILSLNIANDKLKQYEIKEKNNNYSSEYIEVLKSQIETLTNNLKENDEVINKLKKDLEKSNVKLNYYLDSQKNNENSNNKINNSNENKNNIINNEFYQSKTLNEFKNCKNGISEYNINTNPEEIKIEEISNSNENKDNNIIINTDSNNNKIENDILINYIEKIKSLQEEVQNEKMINEILKGECQNENKKIKEKTEEEFSFLSGCMYNIATEYYQIKLLYENYLRLYGHLDKKGLLKLEKNRKYDKNIYDEIL